MLEIYNLIQSATFPLHDREEILSYITIYRIN